MKRFGHAVSAATAAALSGIVLAGAGVPAQAAPQRVASPRPVYGGTLNLATQNDPQALDPAKVSDVVSDQFSYLMFNTLVTYAPTSTTIVPSLATHWTHNAKGTVWTFTLRRGVTFSNGDAFNAAAVAFTYTRLNEGATSAPYQFSFAVIKGAAQAMNATKTAPWPATKYLSGIRILNPYRIRFTLTNPERYFLNVLALASGGIEDPAVASRYFAEERAGKPIDPIGTGPFILKAPGASPTQYVFTKNPHYWVKGLPYLNRINIHIGADPALQLEQFQKGQLSALPAFLTNFGIAPAQYLDVLKSPTLKSEYFLAPNNGVNYLGFNVNTKPWNSLKVRQAVEYALNKAFLDKVMYNGRAQVANSILPPAMPGYQGGLNLYPVNDNSPRSLSEAQSKARQLLRQAGYSAAVNGGTFWVIAGPGDTILASVVKTELAAVGIDVTPKIVGFDTFLNAGEAKPSKLGFYALGWSQDYPDPQDFLFNLFDGSEAGGNNFDYTNDAHVNRLLGEADASLNESQRLKLYDEVQTIAMRNAWVVPYAFNFQDGLLGKNVYPKTRLIWAHPVQPAELDRVWVAK